MHASRAGCLAVLAVAVLAAPLTDRAAAAQEVGDTVVPLELVRLLLPPLPVGGAGSALQVMVGELPGPVADLLELPDEARVLGSFVYPRYSRSAVALVEPPAAADRAIEERLTAAGLELWHAPADGGFVDTRSPGAPSAGWIHGSRVRDPADPHRRQLPRRHAVRPARTEPMLRGGPRAEEPA